MKRNLCVCRKEHKAMSNMIRGISLRFMNISGYIFFFVFVSKGDPQPLIVSLSKKDAVLNVKHFVRDMHIGSEVKLTVQMFSLVTSDKCSVSPWFQAGFP